MGKPRRPTVVTGPRAHLLQPRRHRHADAGGGGASASSSSAAAGPSSSAAALGAVTLTAGSEARIRELLFDLAKAQQQQQQQQQRGGAGSTTAAGHPPPSVATARRRPRLHELALGDLEDAYDRLIAYGFSVEHVEQAMSVAAPGADAAVATDRERREEATAGGGGGAAAGAMPPMPARPPSALLLDGCLDWLLLNVPSAQLPARFAATGGGGGGLGPAGGGADAAAASVRVVAARRPPAPGEQAAFSSSSSSSGEGEDDEDEGSSGSDNESSESAGDSGSSGSDDDSSDDDEDDDEQHPQPADDAGRDAAKAWILQQYAGGSDDDDDDPDKEGNLGTSPASSIDEFELWGDPREVARRKGERARRKLPPAEQKAALAAEFCRARGWAAVAKATRDKAKQREAGALIGALRREMQQLGLSESEALALGGAANAGGADAGAGGGGGGGGRGGRGGRRGRRGGRGRGGGGGAAASAAPGSDAAPSQPAPDGAQKQQQAAGDKKDDDDDAWQPPSLFDGPMADEPPSEAPMGVAAAKAAAAAALEAAGGKGPKPRQPKPPPQPGGGKKKGRPAPPPKPRVAPKPLLQQLCQRLGLAPPRFERIASPKPGDPPPLRYKVVLAPGGGPAAAAAAAGGAARRVALAKAARGERPAWLTAGPARAMQLHDEDDADWQDVQEAQHAASTRALFELRVAMLLLAGEEEDGKGGGGSSEPAATPEEEAARRDAAAADLASELVAPYAGLVARWASREGTQRDEGETRRAEEGRAAFLRGLLGGGGGGDSGKAAAVPAAPAAPAAAAARSAPPPPPPSLSRPAPDLAEKDKWDDDSSQEEEEGEKEQQRAAAAPAAGDSDDEPEEWELAAERGDFDRQQPHEEEQQQQQEDAATRERRLQQQRQHDAAARATSARLRREQAAFWASDEGRSWLARRASLPIYQVRDRVLQALRDPDDDEEGDEEEKRGGENGGRSAATPPSSSCPTLLSSSANSDVAVVGGETGSGKTTQVPQYLLEDAIARGKGASARVIVTQPRRIAAVSVAERVSQERGEVGGPGGFGSLVGYHVRLDAAATRETRLLFCTTGVLLRRMASDRGLEGVSHVVVDEVHERTLQGDFLMALLRRLVAERRAARRRAAAAHAAVGSASSSSFPSRRLPPPLKVVLMSATLDAELYADYFGDLDGAAGGLLEPSSSSPHAVAAGLAVQRPLSSSSPSAAAAHNNPPSNQIRPPPTPVPVIACGGRTFPVEVRHLEDVYAELGYRLAPESRAAVRGGGRRAAAANAAALAQRAGAGASAKLSSLMGQAMGDDEALLQAATGGSAPNEHYDSERYAPYPAHVRASLARLEEGPAACVDLDLVEELVHHVDATRPPGGAILVFLPGMAEIGQLLDRLRGSRRFGGRGGGGGGDNSRWVLPLHSSVSPQQQRQAFASPPPNRGLRKVVLATNIAETSVTIEDVVYVIDTGRHKERRHDPKRHASLLVEDWVSAAAAKQRRGRAGRVQPGECFCTYTSHRAERLRRYGTPEIARVPLEELALQIHLLGLEPAASFLREVIEPPPARAVEAALAALVEVGALELLPVSAAAASMTAGVGVGAGGRESEAAAAQAAAGVARARAARVLVERLTPLGRHLAALPMEPRLGKLLVLAAALGCLSPALTIAAGMSYRSPFAAAFEEQQELEAARRALAAPAPPPGSAAAAVAVAAAASATVASSSSKPTPTTDWPASNPPGFRNLAAGQQSDHLVLVAAFDVWRCALRAGGARGAARVATHYRLSIQALEAIAELREQFAAMLADVRLLQPPPSETGARGGRSGGRGGARGAGRAGRGGRGGRGGGRGGRGRHGGGGEANDDDDDNDDPGTGGTDDEADEQGNGAEGAHHLGHLEAAVSWADDAAAPHNRLAAAPEMVKAVLAAALAPRVAVFADLAAGGGGGGGGASSSSFPTDAASRPAWRAGAAREVVAVHPGSVNHPLLRYQWRHPQLVYLEKAGGGGGGAAGGGGGGASGSGPSRVYLRDTTAVSGAALLLFAGGAPLVLHDEAAVVVGGWLRLRVAPAAAVLVRQLRAALDALLAAAVGGGGGCGGGQGGLAAAVHLAPRVVDAIRLLLAEAEEAGGGGGSGGVGSGARR